MSNLEVKQIDNINYIFLERSRSGWIKYVVFDGAVPKYLSHVTKYLSPGPNIGRKSKYLTKFGGKSN